MTTTLLLDLFPIALLGALLGMDVVTFPQAMISRPIVAATVAGSFMGNPGGGMIMGVVLELLALGMLPFGASRYPEWGSASVVGGATYAVHAANLPGALAVSLLAALVTALVSGWSMVKLRRLNAAHATRRRDDLEAGSPSAVIGNQLFGLTADLVRGGLVTFLALLLFRPVVDLLLARWTTDAAYSRGVVVAIVAAVSAGAIWKIFHTVNHARLYLLAGLATGAAILIIR